jgi:cytochrome c oxidase subunit II
VAQSKSIGTFLIAGAVFVVLGIVIGSIANVFPVQASAEAVSIDRLFNFMLAIAVVIFLIVEGGIIYTIIRFRKRKGDEGDGIHMHGNIALEITWTVIPAIIVTVLSIYSWSVYNQITTPGENPVTIRAVGQQFVWAFSYDLPPDNDPEMTEEKREKAKQYMTSATLYLPLNRAVTMEITSKDVIHSFYIPEFRVKQDATPGRTDYAYFTPAMVMESWVLCAELCGGGHGAMSQSNRFRIVETAEYDAFVNNLYVQAKEIVNNPRSAEVGRQLIANAVYACGGCHVITELGTVGKQGPALDGVATRAEGHAERNEGLVGGTDAAAYLRGSIVATNSYLVSGFAAGVMPQNYNDPAVMSEDDREAIILYLLTLK